MNSLVKGGFSCVVFPFQFDAARLVGEAFNAPLKKQNGKEDRIWEPDKLRANHMKENISSMLGLGTMQGRIGQVYALRDSMRRELGIPDGRTTLHFSCRGREDDISCKLPYVRLALFDTGVGFLEYTFSGLPEDPEAVVDLNYFLCEIKGGGNLLHFTRKLGKEEQEEVSLSLSEMMRKLTEHLGEIHDFDAQPGLHYVDNKPLLFSYLLLDQTDADFGRLLFNLRTNFKSSYQVPQEQYDLQQSSGVFHPFDNVWWGTSLNATVCCAALTENEKTNEFFRTTFPSNLRETYLQLFLLRQHQRYCMQKLQNLYAAAGSELLGVKSEDIPGAYQRITDLRERGVSFKLRCMFSDPATVEHINEYDRFVRDNLHIPQTMRDFEDSVDQLSRVAAALKEKMEAQEQKKREERQKRRDNVILVFTAVWTTIVGFSSAWDISETLTGQSIWFDTPWIILPIVLALLPVSVAIYDLIRKQKKK